MCLSNGSSYQSTISRSACILKRMCIGARRCYYQIWQSHADLLESVQLMQFKFSSLDDNQLSWERVSADSMCHLLKYQAGTQEARTIKWKLQIKVKKQVSFSPEKRKQFIWYLFNSCIFHILHCIFLNEMF